MQFQLTQDFPAGLQRLWTVFGRLDYPLRKYHALGATAVRVRRFHATAQAIDVELERDVAVARSLLPVWTRALIGDEQTLRHHTVWRRTSPTEISAELDISPVGLPVRAHAKGTLVERTHDTSRMVLRWHVESILGKIVERVFAKEIRGALAADHAFTLQYLQESDRPAARSDTHQGTP